MPIRAGSIEGLPVLLGDEQLRSLNRARLVDASSDLASSIDPLASLYVSDAGGALRTLMGDAHRHVIGVYPSWKTGLAQPYEGLGEQALIEESEILAKVLDYQTQAFRLRMMIGGAAVEWICDHLRQLEDGTIEAIEVKQHPEQMKPDYVLKISRAREILGRIGWRVRVRYEKEIAGSPQFALNRGQILAHRSAHTSEEQLARLEELRARSPRSTFAAVRDAMDPRPLQGKAVVHALICAGRVVLDLDEPIRDATAVELKPVPRFISKIRF
ncbi:hypothetical protein GON01_02790 [Sphingomonas sp. MAH-20]|uniref:Uncharacterized protein n=1 Tax=Sphingomonas horti TaxID=2682842 RepID=A0A6I4IXN5_9SPHN|nr:MULTISPECIES: hypothetical protein [Sphingomonas]MBA2920879.1 hypothetical protein [Sphingomonas sp. CGMCC 1.13658]MVO76865.1 hypothetical protein [Sphingomonas horti]